MQSIAGCWSFLDPILGFFACCHLLTQPADGGPKCDGLYVPLIPLQREITWDAECKPDIHGHAFANVKVSVILVFCLSLSHTSDQYVIERRPIKVNYSRHAS